METRYYITGTLGSPGFLARSKWPPPERADDPPHVVYDPITDDWVANPAIGRWILNGDLKLTEIHTADVEDVKARIRLGFAAVGLLPQPAPVPAVPAADSRPDVNRFDPTLDPIDAGLGAVRYENVFGHRPGQAPPEAPKTS